MAIGILIVGDEILSGRRQDKHLSKVIELLGARGLRLSWARLCGDERPRLVETIKQCLATGDVLFSFGGIGATPDDHTRQAVAEAMGIELALHPEAEVLIQARMQARFGSPATANQLEMGRFPVGARIIPNPYNQIPGFAVGQAYFLPGFPVMAWPMMEWALDNELRDMHNAEPYLEESMWVFDAAESQITDMMRAVQAKFGVTVFSLPSAVPPGERSHLELGAKGAPEAVAAAMAAMLARLAEQGFETRTMLGSS